MQNIFTAQVLNLPEHLKSRDSYAQALTDIGWKLLEWDENPLRIKHQFSPVRVLIETPSGQQKDFIIIRAGNSATFAVVKNMNNVPHVLVRNEEKSTGINIVTMPSGYIESGDNSIGDGALRKLFEEASISPTQYIAVNNSAASLPNNSTNTSTSFITEIPEDSRTPKGWYFIPLKDASAIINHMPSQLTANAAAAYYNIVPEFTFTKLEL